MSSPFAYLATATRKARRHADMMLKDYDNRIVFDTFLQSLGTRAEAYEYYFEQAVQNTKTDIKYMLRMKEAIEEDFNELLGIEPKEPTAFMITIRPDDTKCCFEEFKEKVFEFVKRKCFKSYTLSFEQKGTLPSELGKGFHVHIVANMKQRSKGEVVRDATSSWKSWIEGGKVAANCIDVILAKRPKELIENYLINYESEDGHKALTKSCDELWRTEKCLESVYTSSLSIKSEGQ